MRETLFETERMSVAGAVALTEASLCAYGESYRHWCIAYSGGKDSTATLAAVVWLIEQGRVPRPRSSTSWPRIRSKSIVASCEL